MRNNFVSKNSVVGGFDPNDIKMLSFKIDWNDYFRKVLDIHFHNHVSNNGVDFEVAIDMNPFDVKGTVLINNIYGLVRFICGLHFKNRGGGSRTSFREN
jgi:hypothetical protein